MQRLTNRERAASFEHMPLKILKVAEVSINRKLVKSIMTYSIRLTLLKEIIQIYIQ